VAAQGLGVNGAPGRASAWATAGGLSIADQITLDDLADKWAFFYDVGYADGEFHALRLLGGPLLTARTLGGLDSAIRADWMRSAR
jgi:hypothetical protein